MEKNKFSAIFDMDGVLIDTTNLIYTAKSNILNLYGIPFTREELRNYCENPLSENIKEWNKKYNLSIDNSKCHSVYYEEQERILKEKGSDSNLLNLLDELDAHAVFKGVGTGSGRERAKILLKFAGLNANMKVIGYFNGHNSLNDLSGADIIINNFSEINYSKLSEMFD